MESSISEGTEDDRITRPKRKAHPPSLSLSDLAVKDYAASRSASHNSTPSIILSTPPLSPDVWHDAPSTASSEISSRRQSRVPTSQATNTVYEFQRAEPDSDVLDDLLLPARSSSATTLAEEERLVMQLEYYAQKATKTGVPRDSLTSVEKSIYLLHPALRHDSPQKSSVHTASNSSGKFSTNTGSSFQDSETLADSITNASSDAIHNRYHLYNDCRSRGDIDILSHFSADTPPASPRLGPLKVARKALEKVRSPFVTKTPAASSSSSTPRTASTAHEPAVKVTGNQPFGASRQELVGNQMNKPQKRRPSPLQIASNQPFQRTLTIRAHTNSKVSEPRARSKALVQCRKSVKRRATLFMSPTLSLWARLRRLFMAPCGVFPKAKRDSIMSLAPAFMPRISLSPRRTLVRRAAVDNLKHKPSLTQLLSRAEAEFGFGYANGLNGGLTRGKSRRGGTIKAKSSIPRTYADIDMHTAGFEKPRRAPAPPGRSHPSHEHARVDSVLDASLTPPPMTALPPMPKPRSAAGPPLTKPPSGPLPPLPKAPAPGRPPLSKPPSAPLPPLPRSTPAALPPLSKPPSGPLPPVPTPHSAPLPPLPKSPFAALPPLPRPHSAPLPPLPKRQSHVRRKPLPRTPGQAC